MNDNVKRDNKKALPKFLLIILLSAIAGGVAGFFGGMLLPKVSGFFSRLEIFLTTMSPVLILGWVLLTVVLAAVLYIMGKGEYDHADPDSDEPPERGDQILSWCMLVNSVGIIGSFLFFAAGLSGQYIERQGIVMLLGGIILGLVFYTVLQKLCVDRLRRENPEKRGSVLDMDFQKKWMGSCDEAEQLNIYKSSFKACTAVNRVCIFGWMILVIWSLCTGASMLLPIAVLLMVWLVQTVTYSLEAMRLEHHNANVNR
ncbi:MAG: DUF3169 family protein [Candidatus Heteroscillospira sp.]|jgi:hypothetical protein